MKGGNEQRGEVNSIIHVFYYRTGEWEWKEIRESTKVPLVPIGEIYTA